MNPVRRKELIKTFQTSAQDSGSCEVQVSLLTERISGMTGHMKLHSKDHHSRLGLSKMVAQRTRLLNYLRDTDVGRYKSLIERLGLRK